MIVVIGSPIGRLDDGLIVAAGTASRVALAAAAASRTVQLVGVTGDDPTADGLIIDLSRGGVGHVALLRDPARATPLEVVPDPDIDDDASADEVADGAPGGERPAAVVPGSGPSLEAADVDLGLRYLTEFAVVVLAEPVGPEIVGLVGEAVRWSQAQMVLVVGPGETAPDGLPPDVIVFEAPDADPDGAFAALVGTFAAALDDGTEPGEAFRASIASDGWTGSEDG